MHTIAGMRVVDAFGSCCVGVHKLVEQSRHQALVAYFPDIYCAAESQQTTSAALFGACHTQRCMFLHGLSLL